MTARAVPLLLVLLLAPPLLADRVVLTDGTEVTGRIRSLDAEGVRIRTAEGEFLLPPRIVREVHGSPAAPEVSSPRPGWSVPRGLLRMLRQPRRGEDLLAERLELTGPQRDRVGRLLDELAPDLDAAVREFSTGSRPEAARRTRDLSRRLREGLAGILTDVQREILEPLLGE